MLEERFKKYGRRYRFISAVGPFALYNAGIVQGIRSDGSFWPPRTNYEIIKPVWNKLKGAWTYPGSSFWGIYGWSLTDVKGVVNQMVHLIPNIENIPVTYDFKEFIEALEETHNLEEYLKKFSQHG